MVFQMNTIGQMNMVSEMIADITICILENPSADSLGHDQNINANDSIIS
jgi:hypothetical protein